MASYGLVMPFLNEDPTYAYGVEFGLLYVRMQQGDEDVIADYFCRANQDQILLAASRLGWYVAEMKPWGKDWLWLILEKRTPLLPTAS